MKLHKENVASVPAVAVILYALNIKYHYIYMHTVMCHFYVIIYIQIMLKPFIYCCISLLCIACGTSDMSVVNQLLKHNYHLSNDSLEQSLEFFSMDDSTAQFTLRVENKYADTLDSYMSNAKSTDGVHFIHNRNNCIIAFELKGNKKDTMLLTKCACPELTVQSLNGQMVTDTSYIIVYR